jgi:hypothetical protein
MNLQNDAPKLIDNYTKFYLYDTLYSCHQKRITYHSILFNAIVFVVFIGGLGIALYYCYKRKPSIEQTRSQMERDQEFILSKIRFYQEQNQKIRESASPITGLPTIDEPSFVRTPE